MLGVEYFAFNTQQPPFNDARLRKALYLAIDRELITDKVLGEGQMPAYSFTPPYMSMPQLPTTAAAMSKEQHYGSSCLYRSGYSESKLTFTLLYNKRSAQKDRHRRC